MAEVFAPTWHDRYNLWIATSQKNAPAFTLPDGRIHTTVNRRKDQASADIIGRAGINAIMNSGIDRNICYEWTHSNIMGNSGKGAAVGADNPAQNLNEQDCKNVAQTIPLSWMEANELGEGSPWGMPYWAPQKSWFYKERRAMYEAAGKPYRNYGTYGGFENYNGDPWLYKTDGNPNVLPNADNAPFKSFIQTVNGARSSCAYFSVFENLGVGAIVKNYADSADYYADYYRKKFAAEVMGKGMGRTGGIGPGKLAYLDWGKIEGLGSDNGDLHNGFTVVRTKPNGSTVNHPELHPHVDYPWLLACNFIVGFCLTDGSIQFDERSPIWGVDPTSDDFPNEPQSWHNASFEAAYRYSQCNRTEGQSWKQARYRFDGSETWIDPKADGTTTLDHASAFGGPYATGSNARRGRPDAMYREKNGALDFWAFDPSQGMHKRDTIIIQPVPNKEYRVTLRGGTLRQFRENI
ncbi:hypothetical protein [Spirosoma areae]